MGQAQKLLFLDVAAWNWEFGGCNFEVLSNQANSASIYHEWIKNVEGYSQWQFLDVQGLLEL